MTALLEARGLTVSYGGVHANQDVDLTVGEGQFVGLIGSNGAGKTTFVDAITGFAPVTHGTVHFNGEDITRSRPDHRAKAGLVRTFQALELFDDLTVRDNLLVACEETKWWQLPLDLVRRKRRESAEERVSWALRTVGLEHLVDRLPEDLSHGQRKIVGVARALAARPKLILLDEPAAGLDAHESVELAKTLRGLLVEGISVFLIDHDMGLVLGVCDEIYVLNFGQIVAKGTPAAIRKDPAVVAAYLGDSGGGELTPIDGSEGTGGSVATA
jgi:branched-chain amino acid transport system ATP-binding protein